MEGKIEENIFMARVSEQNERWQDMKDFLKLIIEEKGADMSTDERALISVAYKQIVSAKRTTWRTVVSVIENPKYLLFRDSLQEYKTKLEDSIHEQCTKIIEQVENFILNPKKGKGGKGTDNAKVFFLKLVADNHRYVAEMSVANRKRDAIEQARLYYEKANAVPLDASNPIKLSAALNHSVFCFEVLDDLEKACAIADESLKKALEKIDSLGEEEFKDAKAIIDMFKNNLSDWKDDEEESKRPIDEVEDD